jgi:hypothetical protein
MALVQFAVGAIDARQGGASSTASGSGGGRLFGPDDSTWRRAGLFLFAYIRVIRVIRVEKIRP